MDEYLLELITTSEFYKIWMMIIGAAAWGCLLGVTGTLAVQEFCANRRAERDRER